jgi:hypothetical protein
MCLASFVGSTFTGYASEKILESTTAPAVFILKHDKAGVSYYCGDQKLELPGILTSLRKINSQYNSSGPNSSWVLMDGSLPLDRLFEFQEYSEMVGFYTDRLFCFSHDYDIFDLCTKKRMTTLQLKTENPNFVPPSEIGVKPASEK